MNESTEHHPIVAYDKLGRRIFIVRGQLEYTDDGWVFLADLDKKVSKEKK